MWNRQPTSLSSHNPNDGIYTFLSNMNLDMYQFDVLFQFKSAESKFRPFVARGLGFSHFGIHQQTASKLCRLAIVFPITWEGA